MIRDVRAGIWTETALFAIASVLLAQMGLGVFLFLIPLQVLYARRGEIPLLGAAAAVVVAIAAIHVIRAASRHVLDSSKGLLLVEVAAITALVIGLILVDTLERRALPILGSKLRVVPRLLLATAVAALLCCSLVLFIRDRPDLADGVKAVFREAADTIATAFAQGSQGLPGTQEIDAQGLSAKMYQIAMEVFPRSALLYYFAILAFSWWAGGRSATRTMGLQPTRLVSFALPDGYVWPLIASLAVVLMEVALGSKLAGPVTPNVGLTVLGYAGWNIGLIMLLLYGMQGLAIIQFAFARYSVARSLRFLVYMTLALLFVSPGANAVVVIGLPALGVSDIWLKYRTRRRNADADEGNP